MRRGVALRLVAAAAILGLVWWQTDSQDALVRLRMADLWWLAAGLVALWVQTILSAWRWRLVAQALGQRIDPMRAIGEYFLGQVVNQTMPGGFVGDVARAVRSADQAGMARAGGAVLAERL
ncbi:MAG: lysylphosphatidylglycerol synthase transmembrane domain-containing protein, partial [Paracoccus sp. (in: a-proteobacteria)]|nr:lysylphosphatidylglycerol synthase transmembrane domain-containing protein [Paracoccus sp. (in: a-proteobacteria)]